MRAVTVTATLGLVLGMVGMAQAGTITVIDESNVTGGTIKPVGSVYDLGEWSKSQSVTSAPAGAVVTACRYQIRLNVKSQGYCSDFEIGLSSTARGGPANYLLVWDNAGGKTDQNLDDDPLDDYEIQLGYCNDVGENCVRTTSAFNGQPVNQTWYFSVKDTFHRSTETSNSYASVIWVLLEIEYSLPSAHAPVAAAQPATVYPTSTTVFLNGKIVDDGGEECAARFRYRKAGGSYTNTSWGFSGYRTGDSYLQDVPDFQPGAQYYFATQARSSAGEGPWSSELSFTAPSPKPEVATLDATGITGTGVTLNGRIMNDGGVTCQYRFRYKQEGGSYIETIYTGSKRTGESFSQATTGLTPGTKYYFAAQAKNSFGEGNWGNELSFTTLGLPVVTAAAATGITARTATLNGKFSDDGGGVCQYQFRYKPKGGSYTETPWAGSLRGANAAFSAAISGLTPSTTYLFAARAKNEGCEGVWSSELSFTTLTIVKPTVTTLLAINVQDITATFVGRIIRDGNDACAYRFRYRIPPPSRDVSAGEKSTENTSPTTLSIASSASARPSEYYTSWTGATRTGGFFSHDVNTLDPNTILQHLDANTIYCVAAQARNSAGEAWGNEVNFTTTLTDVDEDTLSDQLEKYLLNRFRPYFLFSRSDDYLTPEEYCPADVRWYIERSELWWDAGGNGISTGNVFWLTIENSPLSQSPEIILQHGDSAIGFTSILKTPQKTAYHIHPLDTWNGDDSNPGRHGESWDVILQKRNVGLYGHVVRANTDYTRSKQWNAHGGPTYKYIKIEYWQFFGYNGANKPADIGDHEGDWATVQLLYDPNEDQIVSVFHYAHGREMKFDVNSATDDPLIVSLPGVWLPSRLYEGPNWGKSFNDAGPDANDNTLYLGIDLQTLEYSHPVVYIESGSHEFWPTANGQFRVYLKDIVGETGATVGDIAKDIPGLGLEIWAPIKTAVDIVNAIKDTFTDAWDTITGWFSGHDDDTPDNDWIVGHIDDVIEKVPGVFDKMGGTVVSTAPNHGGLDWGHCYLTEDVPNLGEVGHPMTEVEGADIILHYNGFYGYYSRLNDPPPGPILHTEWTYPLNDPNRALLRDDLEN